ncbi:MAG: hypothetical protein U0359_39270 [Byssovorax sp.]
MRRSLVQPDRAPRPGAVILIGAALALTMAERLVLAQGAAAGDPARVALTWKAPEGCPAAAEVSAEVDRLLGPKGARPAAPIQAEASVVADDRGGYRVHLETRSSGPTRVREIKGSSCKALADATALILAMMIDPSAALASAPPSASASAPPPPAPPPSASASAPPAPPPSASASTPPPPPSAPPAPPPRPIPSIEPRAPRAPLTLGFSGQAVIDAGSLPGVSPGLSLGAAVGYRFLRGEIGALFLPARDQTAATKASAGATVDLLAGTLTGCFWPTVWKLQLGPCAGLELGRIRARAFGVTSPGEGTALWSAFRAGGGLAWSPIAPLFLGLRLEMAVPLQRPGFVIGNVGTVYRPSPVAAGPSAVWKCAFEIFDHGSAFSRPL